MKLLPSLSALLLALAVAACATKPTPHKLQSSAPGENAAPTTSTW